GAEGQEGGDESAGLRGQGAALDALAADPGFHEGPAEGFLRRLDAAPDVAVALAEVGRRLLDGAGPAPRLEDLGDAEPEGVTAAGFQPHLDAWRQRDLLRAAGNLPGRHGETRCG